VGDYMSLEYVTLSENTSPNSSLPKLKHRKHNGYSFGAVSDKGMRWMPTKESSNSEEMHVRSIWCEEN
jgi:hypothetical protein